LEKLQRYKNQVLENELMRLALLNKSLERANDALAGLERTRERCRRELSEKRSAGGLAPAAFQLYFQYDGYLQEEIREAEKVVARIAAQIEKQVEIIRELRLETKSLEIMKNDKLTAYKKEELKESERGMVEFVNTARAMRYLASAE
jgi:flagellar export protein FliJ